MLKFIKYGSYILVLVGALNWGLVGFFNFDLVAKLFGDMTPVTRLVYDLVGISAIISAISAYNSCIKKHNM